jgi:transposase InsO family protein
MELTHQLTPMLRTLRLSGILETLDVRHRQAVEQQSSFVEFLTTLLHDEVERRAQSKLRLRLRRAAFDPTKTLEGFDLGTLKGVGRIYQQPFIDTYAKVGFAKLYDRKTPLTAADLLNDRVLPFYETHHLPLMRILTDRGTEYCGAPDRHEYELYLAVEDIDHTRTKTKSPQTNGICERLHKTMLNEFYRVAFRKKLYRTLEELQTDLDAWLREYNDTRPHQGRWCYGKTPMQTFLDSVPAGGGETAEDRVSWSGQCNDTGHFCDCQKES